MSSANGKMEIDKSPNHKSSRNHSSDTLRTRRSHRSPSRDRERERKDRKPRDRDYDDRRRNSRDRGSEKGRDKERSRERSHRDRDRRRDRDDGRHRNDRRERGESRRDDGDRRRKRDEVDEHADPEEPSKRLKPDDRMDGPPPPPPGGSPPPPPRDSPNSRTSDRRNRSRDGDRRYDDRSSRRSRGPRDEFDDYYYDRRDRDSGRRGDRRRPPGEDEGYGRRGDRRPSPPPPPPPEALVKRSSPSYEEPTEEPPMLEEPREDDSEARSVFVSQLAARLTARDLGYFFEDKLGEGTVMDSRIVTDRLSRRSKGIGYVEFRTIELVDKALALRGTVVMGLPIMVQLTESERNKLHAGDGNLNLPPGVTAPQGGAMQLYVGSLHFNLTEADIKQVFEPFGELEFVDLHRDPMTGRSKGYAFVQYKKVEDARMALEQMEGFELAGRTLRVNTVHEKGTAAKYTQADTLDESGGGNLNAASRQALMQKLARIEPAPVQAQTIMKPNIPQAMQSESVLLNNMFDPEEETERDWDKELADEVRSECEDKYGPVAGIKVEKETQGEIYIKFKSIESAQSAIQSLNGRYFGGRSVSAAFIPNAIFQAHQ